MSLPPLNNIDFVRHSFAEARYCGSSVFSPSITDEELRKVKLHSESISAEEGFNSQIFDGEK